MQVEQYCCYRGYLTAIWYSFVLTVNINPLVLILFHPFSSIHTGLYNRTGILPTNRGGFIAQNNNEVLSNAQTDSVPVIVITAIALTAGVFAILFFSIIFVLVSHRICQQEQRRYLHLAQMETNTESMSVDGWQEAHNLNYMYTWTNCYLPRCDSLNNYFLLLIYVNFTKRVVRT